MAPSPASLTYWTAEDWQSWPERQRARTMNSLSVSSATLVGTVDQQGQHNLSIVSSVVHLGSAPALLGMVLRPPGANAHTYKNLLATGQCSFSHVNENIFKQAHQCSARYDQDVSEFKAVGLTPWFPQDTLWKAPAVAESHVKMGLTLKEDIPLPNGCRFMVCALQWVALPEELRAPDGYIAIGETDTLTISGLDGYHLTKPLGRLSYAKVSHPVEMRRNFMQGWED